jgi:hypothetical protein
MYNYLGTFTKAQLLERHAFLRAQVYALPNIIITLQTQRDNIGKGILTDSAPSYAITSQTDDKTYQLGSVSVSTLNSSTSLDQLTQNAIQSRYPLRVDPLSNIISHGDAVWRIEAKLPVISDYIDNVDTLAYDNKIPSQRSIMVLKSFRGTSKRQESVEAKVGKLRYRYLRLSDEIIDKQTLLSQFEDELSVLENMLNKEVTLTNTKGETVSTSDYPTAGVETKTDVTNPEDVDRLYDLFLPPIYKENDTNPNPDQTASQVLPTASNTVPISTNGDGSIEDLIAEFPITGKNIKDRRILQLIANVYIYGYKKGLMGSIVDSASLIRSPKASGYRYLAPNVKKDLDDYAQEVHTKYGVRFRVTEAWPPTRIHASRGHFTGNSLDLAMDLVTPTKEIIGLTLPDLAQKIIDLGIQRGWVIRGTKNEYAKQSAKASGPHIHLNMNVKYFNDGKLYSL